MRYPCLLMLVTGLGLLGTSGSELKGLSAQRGAGCHLPHGWLETVSRSGLVLVRKDDWLRKTQQRGLQH